MDFQCLVNGVHSMACVISVDKESESGDGICIAAANSKFTDMIEIPQKREKGVMLPEKFVPGCPYYKYIPRDKGFEDVCFRSAVGRELVHTYAHLNRLDIWLNIIAIPLDSDDPDRVFCLYILEIRNLSDIDLMDTQYSRTSADVLRTCIKLHDTNDFIETIKDVIKDIRLICEAEVCSLMLIDQSKGTCSILATDIREHSKLKRVTQFSNFFDIAVSWIDTIGESDCLIIKNEEDMKYISKINNPWYLTLEEAGVDSVVMFPLRHNGEILGFIWATNFDTENTLRIKETLELTAFFLASEVASYKMLENLEYISYTDQLTGVMNRNAMNSRITSAASGEEPVPSPCGVVFADLNGLKKVNDTKGHSAGDILLKKAAIVLQECFGNAEIYRAGGDEFLIILPACTEKDFDQKVCRLKETASDPDGVCFAVGSCLFEDGDIRRALHLSDVRMYDDKELFYSEHPDRKYSR